MNTRSYILRHLVAALLTFFAIGRAAAFPLNVAGLDTLHTAVWIYDLRWGYDVVSANIDRSLVPASVMKSVTCASLLNLSSPDERFVTRVTANGPVTSDSVLTGNLVIYAIGDPTIESQFLPESQGFVEGIVRGLQARGIRRIQGDVIVDESAFPDATTPPGWMAEDIVWPYGARLWGANFHDNRFRLSLPGGSTKPEVPGLTFKYVAPSRRTVTVDRKDGSETFLVSGRRSRAFSDTYSMPYPAKAMRAAVVSAIKEAGIDVTLTPASNVGSVAEPTEIYSHQSPTFAEIMQSLMHRSDNLMAEGMLRAIAPGSPRSSAIAEENAVWAMWGIGAHGVNIVDGSGLSRNNRLTARFLGEIYRVMLAEQDGDSYVSLFPRAGFDGTMREFLADTPLEGRVVMKTGSMKGVQSYSGYLLDEEGRPSHVLVFMANDFKCSRQALKNDIQRLLLELFSVSLQSEGKVPPVSQ